MLHALSDFISKVTRGEKLTIGGQEAQWKKVAELTPGMMIAVPAAAHAGAGVEWDEIVSIRRLPPEQVYDIEVEGTHNFVANRIFAHNTAGKALAIFNETGDQNILVASASGTTQFTVGRTGIVTAAQFQDQADTTYFLDPAATGTGLKLAGDIELTGGGTISSTANNNITIDAGSGTVCIGTAGTCAGKLDAGTLDPPYTINGKKYATYVPSMVGIKEETTGTVATQCQISRRRQSGYGASATNVKCQIGETPKTVIDFRSQEEGSDLWLFSKVTALKKHIGKMTVLLSPAANTRSWYEVDPQSLRLTIFTSTPTTVSYRLSAPRFDAEEWQNTRDEGSIGHVINDPDLPAVVMDDQGYLSGVELTRTLLASSQGESLRSKTTILSPLSDETDDGVAVALGPSQTFGIYTKEGSPSAVFDEKGNATFSGTLYADRIVTKFGEIGNLQTTTISATYITNAITNITNVIASDSAAISSSPMIDATSSALLALLENKELGIKNYGENQTLPDDVSLNSQFLILNSLLLSGPLIIGSDGISATSDTLYIEKGKTANLDIMAGTIIVNTTGDVIITGNLAVSGNVAIGGVLGVNRISPSDGELTIDLTRYGGTGTESGELVSRFGRLIIEQEGKEVAVITASGSALFAGDVIASGSGVFKKLMITGEASASAGLATLPAGATQITIPNTNITPESLIYVTPVSSTGNQVLYIYNKEARTSFTVAVDQALETAVTFNWWIIN